MARPEQPEPERSGLPDADPDLDQELPRGRSGPAGPVPPANQPGHHDAVDQDKPQGPPPKPAKGTKSTKAAKGTKATKAPKAAESTKPAPTTKAGKPTGAAKTSNAAKATKAGKSAKAAKTTGKAAPAKPAKATKPTKAAKASSANRTVADDGTRTPPTGDILGTTTGDAAAAPPPTTDQPVASTTTAPADAPAPAERRQRFDFAFDARLRPAAAAFGVLPGTAHVEVGHGELHVRFGLWSLRTPVANVAATEVTGPYRWWKVAGPARVSASDLGVTFATTARAGLCIRFHDPVAAALPKGLLRHSSATVTVADPAALAEALAAAA